MPNPSRSPRTSLLLTAALLCVAAAASGDAKPWTKQNNTNARVHDHTFDRVAVSGSGCELTVKVWFTAPKKAYEAGAPVRNSYLFRARAKLKNGQEVITDVFRSGSPARRNFTHTVDTTAEGCWAKEPNQAVDLNVIGCRGRRCRMPTFE